MATVATRIVEVEFDAGVWTAVTADVVAVSTQRGRNKESGAFDTGRMQVTLRNDTRKYDPDNTAGTYYGKLRPNRRIRFRAAWPADPSNLLTANQAGIETDATGWGTLTNATVARSTAQAQAGAASLAMTATAGGTMSTKNAPQTTVAVTPGLSYTATAWFRAATATRNVQVNINWRDAALGLISTTTGTATADSAAAWTQRSVAGVAPALSAYATVELSVASAGAGEVHYADTIFVSQTLVTHDIYLGYIDRITQDYGGPNDATATIEASDFFKLLNRAELAESVYQAEVSDSAPKHWWPLSEPSGSTAAVDVVAGTVATSSGVTFGGAGLVTMDPASTAVFDNTADVLTATVSDVAIGTTVAFTLEAIVKIGTLPADDANIVTLQQAAVANFAGLAVWGSAAGADAGKVAFAYNSLATGTDGIILGANINDGNPHHIMATVTSAGVETLYIDGVSSGTPTSSGALTYTGTMPVYIGNNASVNRGWNGLIGHVALYDTALASSDALAHYEARATPWDDDTPGERLARVFLLVNAAGDYELDDGSPPTLQSTELGGTALDYAQTVEETALGRLFVAKDGTVRFLGRDEAEEGTYLTSQATLVDDDSGAGTPYRDVSQEVDEATLVTRATVSRENGTAVTYRDDTAIAEFGVLDETHSGLLHDDDAYSLQYAQLIVNTHKTPATRVGTVELELAKDPAAMFPAILALEIADRVTYKRKPQNTGATISLQMRVEAISHDTGSHYWRTRLFLTPIGLGTGGYGVGVWDSSLWDQAYWGI